MRVTIRRCDFRINDKENGFKPSGKEAHQVPFYSEGNLYVADLCKSHEYGLKKRLAPYVMIAQEKEPRAGTGVVAGVAAMRKWLKEQGYTVPVRGRVPGHLQKLYEERDLPTPQPTVDEKKETPEPERTEEHVKLQPLADAVVRSFPWQR